MKFVILGCSLVAILAFFFSFTGSSIATASPARVPAIDPGSCKCVAGHMYSNGCTCGISLMSLTSESALCSEPPQCADIMNKCTATFMFAFVGQCGTGQHTLGAVAICDGFSDSYKRCPGATTAIGLHLSCSECQESN